MDYTDKMLLQKEKWIQKNEALLRSGVFIMDTTNTYIDEDVEIGEDSIIYPNVFIEKGSKLGKQVKVLPNSFISNSTIEDNTTIDSSKIVDSRVGKDSVVGPMSHLRNKTNIIGKARIGNFVEMKNTNFGLGSKCAHLTYLGDSDVGERVNFGCGVVTVNYDGKNKFRTVIGDGAFIGSNVNLIAPVRIGKNALLAAGSTINKDVEDGAMGIARPYQENKEGLGNKYKNK
ncbi:UDP-N-acetylglucosamine diphosphorylase/glucosamine-1-phosphate N-acetyltransferase [Breznakia sp. PF5-3]|uniref:DapH/DapD/GlmU-related protein n=1 Tax=unclassified Breznakia TaxID=2623764 RepID=UPI002405FF8F|nr:MULTISPECIES: DapH/DapD/GlmU-related protein [unclassified Breznakia]MDF9825411.1 UDP-N-acetylglucosamine diphosphorylase/glucosamine-1-phosphate N-acetyltransferase [Breznakia sp. PM6-1]MDF9836289.1 UDP-N-acetylglucosamine diphosphorylase/glucosamine-1-phosphate N-acetyltransferase [Breznakia sp. PF5-3]MDF9838713.1 UDP-N-acetylglucosamine diphosphorylase/glucosamine-1-phosphate N-acetyltransferase [Breznakia sp. PFB2-8]MDF9860744.1 UDP-N-acetylglucosamine diphosphorylase/glucosamine-1-phosp